MLSHDHLSERQHSITTEMQIQGWSHLDPLFLAALATEAPLLLIGPHGTAKTLLVERMARALHLSFRHYNASLLNYDDLVGIPYPEEGTDQLRFITTPGAIWDAEFVFFDEISRCRPDLQNKLFPIVHERRVVGMDLKRLRYRWAAMNPPSPDEPGIDTGQDLYLGSEPLDPALIDRFPFVIPVPNWHDISREDRKKILMQPSEVSEPSISLLGDLVAFTSESLHTVSDEYGELLADYIVTVMDLLDKARLAQSPRRARMLVENIAAIHAARQVILGEEIDIAESAELGLKYGVPQLATEVPPSLASLMAIHRQAWEVTHRMTDDQWRVIFEESDPIRRVLVAEDQGIDDDELSRLITQALAADAKQSRKVGLAVAMILAFRRQRPLNPAAWEPLVMLASRVLQPRQHALSSFPAPNDMAVWNELRAWAVQHRRRGRMARLEVNYVLGGFPEFWREQPWREALDQFKQDLNLFGIQENYL